MYGNVSGSLLRLSQGHGSWKRWTLGETVIGYGIQAQESCCGLEGVALGVESHPVLSLAVVNDRATTRAALGKLSAQSRPMAHPRRDECETVTAQGCTTVSSAVRGEACPSRLVSGHGMADAEGGSDS